MYPQKILQLNVILTTGFGLFRVLHFFSVGFSNENKQLGFTLG